MPISSWQKFMRSCRGWHWPSKHSSLPVIIQYDSMEGLSIFSGDDLARSAYGHLGAEINAFRNDREFIPHKISRYQNTVADLVALTVPRLCGYIITHLVFLNFCHRTVTL